MTGIRRLPIVWSGLGALVLIFAFHNCSKAPQVHHASDKSSSTSSNLNGGGVGYDGKVSFKNLLTNGVCPDGSNVNSEIWKSSDTYTMVRENCAALTPPRLLDASQMSFAGSGQNTLIYLGTIYQNLAAGSVQASLVCNDSSGFSVTGMTIGPQPYLTFTNTGYDSGLFPVQVANGAQSETYNGIDGAGDSLQLTVDTVASAFMSYSGSVTITYGAAYQATHPGVTSFQKNGLTCYRVR